MDLENLSVRFCIAITVQFYLNRKLRTPLRKIHSLKFQSVHGMIGSVNRGVILDEYEEF